MLKPGGLSRGPGPPHLEARPRWSRHRALLGSALVEPRLERTEILVLKSRLCKGSNLFPVICMLLWKHLPFSAEVWPPKNCRSESALPSLSSLSLDHFVSGSRLLSLPSFTRHICVLFLTYTVWVWFYCFFFPLPAKCEPACRHGGVCIRPNKCLCKKGYLGPQCEQMDRDVRRVTRAGILDQIIDMTSYLLDLTSYIV